MFTPQLRLTIISTLTIIYAASRATLCIKGQVSKALCAKINTQISVLNYLQRG